MSGNEKSKIILNWIKSNRLVSFLISLAVCTFIGWLLLCTFIDNPDIVLITLGATAFFLLGAVGVFSASNNNHEKFDQVTNSIKNVMEIVALIGAGYLTYQSTWFDHFYNKQEVNIIGETLLVENGIKKELKDNVSFDYKFFESTNHKNNKTIRVISQNGIIQTKVKLDRKLDRVLIFANDNSYRNFFPPTDTTKIKNKKDDIFVVNKMVVSDNMVKAIKEEPVAANEPKPEDGG